MWGMYHTYISSLALFVYLEKYNYIARYSCFGHFIWILYLSLY